MILDPSVKGCTIWHNQMVTTIRGNADEVCREIYKRVTVIVDFNRNGNPIVEQLCDIGIDIGGIGIEYKHILSEMGIRTYDIRCRNEDIVLPVRNEQMVGINNKFYEQKLNHKSQEYWR
ncbi:MAG: hypothetical protein RSF81_08525 [Oscillospiraceae bacterium]